MKKRWLCMLLAVLMLCALVGCKDAKPNSDTDTPTTTTTTTQQAVAPIELVEDEVNPDLICYHCVDEDTVAHNEELVFKANVDLTNVQFWSLNPVPPTMGEVLFTQPLHYAGQYWCIHTYINDIVPNRGISCTDESGTTYYYAITWSGKDGTISLKKLEITNLSDERLTEIETYLNDIKNNGFVSMNEYACPEEANLFSILYDGAGIGVDSWDWSKEEQNDYLIAAEWEEWYISAIRFKRTDIETLVQKKLGIPMSALTKDVDMLYIEKYDAFYHAHSDTQYQSVAISDGYIEGGEGGLYVVNYVIGSGDNWSGNRGCVTLKPTDDGFQFISNSYIEE